MFVTKITFEIKGDERGQLISLESGKNIPFDIKRVYYIYGSKNDVRRGLHAHFNNEQAIICLNGSCKILFDNGKEKEIINLDKRSEGYLINKMIWHEMFEFTEDCIILCLSNSLYDEKDYIRDYQKFLTAITKINE